MGATRKARRRAKLLHHFGQPAVDAYTQWESAVRPLACARYVDGMLDWCTNRGTSFWDLECDARFDAEENALVPPLPQRPTNLGCYGVDLRKEERRSGVPPWFMPNASRRARAHVWTHHSPWHWVHYVGHLLRMHYGGRGEHHRLELLLYLREGEHPFTPHHSDAVYALLNGLPPD
jgi:hypothetical protein